MFLSKLWACIRFLAALYPASGAAQSVQLVVPLAAGGVTDIFARTVAQPLSEEIKRPVVVINRPGGGGAVAIDFVSRERPDGQTLLVLRNRGPVLTAQHVRSWIS